MKPKSFFKRRRELFYRITNTFLLRLLSRLYAWYGLKGEFHINASNITYNIDGITLGFYPGEYGSTLNADAEGSLGENTSRVILVSAIPSDGVFYDIGAHEGTYTLFIMTRRPDVRVYSFEPLPERLLQHLEYNGLLDSNVYTTALGDHEDIVTMATEERSKNHIDPTGRGERTVQLQTLDSIVASANIPPPDFIKIDIEGMEFSALRGAKETLIKHNPCILCEINHNYARYGVNLFDFLMFMEDIGYNLYCQTYHATLRPVVWPHKRDVSLYEIGKSAYENFWFVPNDRTFNLPIEE